MTISDDIQRLEQGIAALESQRLILGDSVVDTAIAPLQERLSLLRAQVQLEQQRKLVTILFADVSGFTALSEKVDAEDVSEVMNALWESLDAAIIDKGGHIDKHLGDGVMAIWGAQTAREDDPERAIRAALEMQRILTASDYRQSAAVPSDALRMRIGIHTGPVLLGALGTLGEYTAVGDTVTLAARLEQSAPVGGILISYDTYRHVRGIFDVTELAPLSLKSEPVQTFRVDFARPRAFRLGARGVEGIETHMVGRGVELRRLKQAVEDAVAGHPLQLILVVGDAGLGKSRLLYELEKWHDTYPGELWTFKARADQQRLDVPFSLARDLFFDRFQIEEGDSQADARQKFEEGMAAFLGPDAQEDAHLVGHLLGLDYSHSPAVASIGGDMRQLRNQAYQVVMRMFRAAAEQDPLLFMLEDLHWADESSLELMAQFLEEFAELPVVMIATARPLFFERFPNWLPGFSFYSQIDLQPLSVPDSRALVNDILRKMRDVPDLLLESIAGNAEGNPYFIEELIKTLIETGALIKKDEDEWDVDLRRLETQHVPQTLTGVLQARLDRLKSSEKVVLYRASVLGRIFWDDAIAHLGEPETERLAPRAAIPDLLAALCEKELIYHRGHSAFPGIQEYLFKNTMLRDVIYEQVLKSQRRLYHRQAADWLVAKSGDRVNEFAVLVAEHYESAVESVLAAEWYTRAARAALDASLSDAAVDYARRALRILGPNPDAGRLIPIFETLGAVDYIQTRTNESVQAYQSMLSAAREQDDLPAQLRALHGLALVYEFQGAYESAIATADQAAALLTERGIDDGVELSQTMLEKARALYYLGRYTEARIVGEKGLVVATGVDAPRQTARLYNIVGMILTADGEYEKAVAYKTQSLERWRALGNRQYEAAVLNNIGENYRVVGDYPRAIEYYEESLVMAKQLGDIGQVVVCLNNLGGALVGLKEYPVAIERLKQIFTISKQHRFTDAESLTFLAEAYLGLGDIENARKAALDAIGLCLAGDEAAFGANAWRVLGLVVARQGAPAWIEIDKRPLAFDTEACFERSLDITRKTGVPRDQAFVLWYWAAFAKESGNLARAKSLRAQARAIFERLKIPLLVAQLDAEIGE